MAISATIGIQVDGAKDAANELRKVSGEIAKTTSAANERRTLRFRQSLAALSRQERQEAFARLSTEEKMTKLTERRAFLERQMLRAQQQGNAYRSAALRLSMAQVSGQMAALGPTGLARIAGQAGQQIKGFFSGIGLPVGLGIAGIGAGLALLVRSIERSVEQSAILADNIEDTADMLGLHSTELNALRTSALEAGVSSRFVYTAVGSLRAHIASALGGDATAMGRFSHYGVTPEMLRSGNVIGIARQINSALGPSGMTPAHERDLRAFFGGRPGIALKMFRDVRESDLEQDEIRKMAAVGASLEQWDALVREEKLRLEAKGSYLKSWALGVANSIPGVRSYGASKLRSDKEGADKADAMLDELELKQALKSGRAGVAPFDAESITKRQDPSPLSGRPTIDALMRIGLFRGGVEARQLGILRDQVSKLNEIVAQLKTLNREVAAE